MRQTILLPFILGLLTSAGVGQPRYGDIVLSVTDGAYGNQNGYTAYMRPSNPGVLTTLAAAPVGSFHNWVRMAPDNTDLVCAEIVNGIASPSYLVNLQMNGSRNTIATIRSNATDGFELDHDGKWVLSARVVPSNPRQNFVLGVDHVSGTVTTFASLTTTTWFNEVCIDRDPGSMPYVAVACCLNGGSGPEILMADRRRKVTALVSGTSVADNTAIELHPRTGDYITGNFHPVQFGHILRIDKTGAKTTLTTFFGNAIRIMQDDTAWIANGDWGIRTLLKYDLTQNAVLTTISSGIPWGWNLTGLEVYGSRTLVCNQQSPSMVTVKVQSRHPSAGPGTQYALAASLARRPGLRFPHGEWLDLNTVSCPLFYLTALNLLPDMFRNFRGTLTLQGNNLKTIQVNIPTPLQGTGIPVFVAGVLFNGAGVFQVTNTHWFVL